MAMVGAVVVVDLATKALVVGIGWPYTINRGVAFSLLSGRLNLPLVSTLVFLFVLGDWIYLLLKKKMSFKEELGFALVIGGSLGNIVDRMTSGGVVDFVRFFGMSFNLADLAITLGLVAIFFSTLFGRRRVGVK